MRKKWERKRQNERGNDIDQIERKKEKRRELTGERKQAHQQRT